MAKKIIKHGYSITVSILIIITLFYYIYGKQLQKKYNRIENEYDKRIFDTYAQYIYPEIKKITLEEILEIPADHSYGGVLGPYFKIVPIDRSTSGNAFNQLIFLSRDADYIRKLIYSMDGTYNSIIKPQRITDPFREYTEETIEIVEKIDKQNKRSELNKLFFEEAAEINELIMDTVNIEIEKNNTYQGAFQLASEYFKENYYLASWENTDRIRSIIYEYKE